MVRNSIYRRLQLLERVSADRELQAITMAHCANNVGDWVVDWCWTYDPRGLERGLPAFLPFDPWPKQLEFLEWLSERLRASQNGVVEKSRDAGASYLCIMFALHRWLFQPGSKFSLGSRKEALVDKRGDPDSLLEKARLILRYLPSWMRPRGFREGKHDLSLRLINPSNDAVITGEAGDNIGRGGRSLGYFIDEFAKVEHAESVDASVSNNADCIIYVSTPCGMGNLFAEKRHSGRYPVFSFHWRDDPRKDDDWYAEQQRDYSALIVAQEIDLDYSADDDAVFIPGTWIEAAKGLKLKNGGTFVSAGLDVADRGKCDSVLIIRRGATVYPPRSRSDLEASQVGDWAIDLAQRNHCSRFCYDRVGVGSAVSGVLRQKQDQLGRKLPFEVVPVSGGEKASKALYDDDPDRLAFERFVNAKTEGWWRVRRRFEKTWETVNGVRSWPEDELISLPSEAHELAVQLALPRLEIRGGKVQVEPKERMRRRGVASPDQADSLVYAFAEPPVSRVQFGLAR
jgi:hypothetical protein